MAEEPTHKARRCAAPLVLAAIAFLIAACGSSHTIGTSADPAGVVPASAPLYAGAVVRPSEPLKAAAQTAGQTLTHERDPYQRLLAALQTPGSPTLDFSHDVAPWLGPRAGIFLTKTGSSGEDDIGRMLSLLGRGLFGSSTAAFPFAGNGLQGAIVLDTSDVEKARSFLDSQAERAGAHAASYRGVSYMLASDGVAFGIVDRFAVIGSESALHGVIETSLGGPSLTGAADYSKLLAAAPGETLAHVYANTGAFLGSSAPAEPSPALGPAGAAPQTAGLGGLVELLAGARPVNISLVPSTTSIALDADALASASTGAPGGLLSSSLQGERALGELPGEAWLAIGLGEVGASLGKDVRGLRTLASLPSSLAGTSSSGQPSSGISVQGLLDAILTPLGILGASDAEAKREFQSWMGSAGLYASGSGLLELKGGIVIASHDPALSSAAVGKLGAKLLAAGDSVSPASIPGTSEALSAKLAGLPVALDIADGRAADGQAKFVIGIGAASVTAALSPTSTLSTAASHGVAASALGEGIQPSISVDFQTLLSLLEGVGLQEDPTISPVVPYLRSLTTLAAGGKVLSSGVERFRLVVGLQGG
jgi:hypothetical protein